MQTSRDFRRQVRGALSERRDRFQPELLAGARTRAVRFRRVAGLGCRAALWRRGAAAAVEQGLELLGRKADRHRSIGIAAKTGARHADLLAGIKRDGDISAVDRLDLAEGSSG